MKFCWLSPFQFHTKLVFTQFKPGDRKAGKISFAVNNIKQSYWLIVNDRTTNKPLMRVSLDNAYKKVSQDVKKRNNKMKKRKKNYYKEDDDVSIRHLETFVKSFQACAFFLLIH